MYRCFERDYKKWDWRVILVMVAGFAGLGHYHFVVILSTFYALAGQRDNNLFELINHPHGLAMVFWPLVLILGVVSRRSARVAGFGALLLLYYYYLLWQGDAAGELRRFWFVPLGSIFVVIFVGQLLVTVFLFSYFSWMLATRIIRARGGMQETS